MNSIEVSAKSVDQAIEIGLFKLNAKKEDVKIIVLEEGGLFDKARVKLILNSALENLTDIEQLVNNFTEKMGLKVAGTIEETPEQVRINFVGEDIGVLIGKRGDVLDSIQYILSQIINKNATRDTNRKVIVDCNGYREKREGTLKVLANRLADKAVKERKPAKLEPMSAYERKIIHLALEKRQDVTTVSKNEEPNRYITIIPNKNNDDPNKTRAYND